jgi:hypothetical protein
VGFCAYLEVPHGILCIFENHRGILCTFGSSSWDFVHFWKFLISFCAFLEVPHGILYIFGISSWQTIHVSILSFHFFSTKYVFLQHAYRLIAAIAGYNQFKTSSCNHEYPGNTTKVDAEEADRNICLAKMSLIRTKPDHFYDMI